MNSRLIGGAAFSLI